MAYKLIYNPLIDYIRSHVRLCAVLYSKASRHACKPSGPTPLEISYACSEITGNQNRNHWKSENQASRQKS